MLVWMPSFALPVQYGFTDVGAGGPGCSNGVALHRDGPVAATLSLDAGIRDVAAVVSREGRTGLIAHYSGNNRRSPFLYKILGHAALDAEAGRVRDGWGWVVPANGYTIATAAQSVRTFKARARPN